MGATWAIRGADRRRQFGLGAACRTSLSCPSVSAVHCEPTQTPKSPPSSYGIARSPKHKAKAAAKSKGKTAGKSKPKGVTTVEPKPQPSTKSDTKKSPPLPEFPGVGNKPPIRYGKSTVFFSPAGVRWRVKPVTGSRVTHGVRWGQSRKDQIENWEKVKWWLRVYN